MKTTHSSELAWLLVPNPVPYQNIKDMKSFLSITTNNLHRLNLPAAALGKTICGSSGGWLIMIDKVSTITLMNPLTSALIQLPQISTEKVLIHKAILSCDPEQDPYNFVVMVIYGEKRKLAYYKARSESWKVLEEAGCYYDDVISDGRRELYAVNEYGKIVSFKISYLPAFKQIFMPWSFKGDKLYLLRIRDDWFVVFRSLKDHSISGKETYSFSVFVLNVEDKSYDRISSFSEVALFLGQNESTWMHADDTKGVVGSCIYFTDDYPDGGGCDFGRYNMEDDSVQRFDCGKFDEESRPIYVMLNM